MTPLPDRTMGNVLVFLGHLFVPQRMVGFGPLFGHSTLSHGAHGALDPNGSINMHDHAQDENPGSDGMYQCSRTQYFDREVGRKPGSPEQHTGDNQGKQTERHDPEDHLLAVVVLAHRQVGVNLTT